MANISTVRLTKATRKSINNELTAQGISKDSPLRYVATGGHAGTRYAAIARDHSGRIVGSIGYDIERGQRQISILEMRVTQQRAGIGQALIRHVAGQTSKLPHGDQYRMLVYGAISSAKPFYAKTGATGSGTSSLMEWSPAALRSLRDGGRSVRAASVNGGRMSGS